MKVYLASSLARVGVEDPLWEVCRSPSDAYDAIVDHAGGEPDDGEPEWPESFEGERWGWNPVNPKRPSYLITECELTALDSELPGEERDE